MPAPSARWRVSCAWRPGRHPGDDAAAPTGHESLFGLYFEHVVPLVGGLISGDLDAYRYLPRSVNAFPPADMLAGIMRDCGLRNVRYQLFALGTVALHIGIKR